MMLLQNKIIVYILAAVFSLSLINGIVGNVKDYFKEPTYTKEAVELIIKHRALKKENENLKLEIDVIERDNERIKQSISADSSVIFDSSRQYRDSLRSALFNR